MKLTSKIHLFTTVLFIILLTLISVAIYFSFSYLTYSSEREEAEQDLERTMREIDKASSPAEVEALFRAYVPTNGMLRVIRADGSVEMSVSAGGLSYLRDQNSSFSEEEQAEVVVREGVPHARVSTPVIWTDGEVVVLEQYERLAASAENLQTLKIVLLVVSLLAVLPLYFSAKWLGTLIVRPVTAMIRTMRRSKESGTFELIETDHTRKDELEEMAETFNGLMERLRENYEKQEQFVANASHELKTPLTVIDSYANLLKRRGREDEGIFGESVEAIRSETTRMYELIQQLLVMARHDQLVVRKETVEMNEVLRETLAVFERGYSRELHFDSSGEELMIETDVEKVKQVLFIFLDNARKYSEGPITVLLTENGGAVIEVKDEGIGMTEEERERVFERFYQADTSRTDGYGLGMSLAQELVRVLGGRIEVESEKGEGTTVRFSLPFSQ